MTQPSLPQGEPSAPPATKDGDRPGLFWRIAIVFVTAVLVWRGFSWLAETFGPPQQDHLGQDDRLGHATRAILATVVTLPLIWLARRYLDRRPWDTLGLATPRLAWRQMLAGMALWFVAAGIGLLVALTVAGVRISSSGSPSRELTLLALGLPVLVFLYEALPEELIFRGYVYRNLAGRLPRWLAVVIQAALFTLWGAAITAAGSGERIIVFFTFSLILGMLRAVTGSIWAGIGFHTAFQWIAQLLIPATTEGYLQFTDRATFEFLVFWLFPIIITGIAILLWSLRARPGLWRTTEPDPLHTFGSGPGSYHPDKWTLIATARR